MSPKPRVRFAPSPTGELHVGNARTALFNFMFSRHLGGDFILRIEDTDESRSALSYQENLIDDLKWLGMDWDEGPQKGGAYGPYKQSERLNIYEEHLKKLVAADLVYPCYCTEEELEEGRKYSYRFKVPQQTVEFNDLIRGTMKFEGEAIGDFIIVRSNGMPAYNFAVVIDDHLMAITHVIRGEDHLSNTALQIMLYRAFGFEPPTFAHHCLILGKDRSKLSKRHGSISVGEFRKQGILPEALLNYLGLLGSSFTEGREVLSRKEMIADFSLQRASKSGAIFDEEKLHWLNAIYIRNCDTEDLTKRLIPFLQLAGYQPETLAARWLRNVIDTVKSDLIRLTDIGGHIRFFFDNQYELTDAARQILDRVNARKVVQAFSEYLESAQGLSEEMYAGAIKYAKEKVGVKGKELFMPIRAALTGVVHGPELDRVFAALGKESALKRLRQFNK